MPTAEEKTRVASFGVEIDTPRNGDVVLNSIPGCRLRGAIAASKPGFAKRDGDTPTIPRDQATHLGALPPIPGMQLHVNPAKCAYTIIDPLYEDDELCRRIQSAMRANERPISGEIRGVPPQKGELDVHRMKTLCRELHQLVETSYAKVVKGVLPSMEEIEDLPGKFLLNPGSVIPNSQPLFEEDMEAWVANLHKGGG